MPNLHDVARLAQVSLSTASKALGRGVESDRISDASRQRVLAACEKLGYHPNHQARALQAGRAFAIGTLFNDGVEHREEAVLWGVVHAGVLATVLQRGNQLVTIGGRQSESPIANGIRAVRERRVDGLIVPRFWLDGPGLRLLEEEAVPAVLLYHPHETSLPVVTVDVRQGGVQRAIQHLADLGHRRLCWVGPGDTKDLFEQRRRKCFVETAQGMAGELSMDFQIVEIGFVQQGMPKEAQIAATRDGFVKRWQRGLEGTTAVVAYNETLGLGVYAAAADIGLRIPQQLSVVGFDDFYASIAYPPMTVVSLMLRDVGARAAALLLEIVEEPAQMRRWRGHRELIPTQLKIRGSTAPPDSSERAGDDPAESTNVADRFPEVAKERGEAIEKFDAKASLPQ
jgi:DNA-binding LacI/PurR family transcriptional regulator